jgi:hypothetical protein
MSTSDPATNHLVLWSRDIRVISFKEIDRRRALRDSPELIRDRVAFLGQTKP